MGDWLAARLLFLIPLILSLSVHEWAHAWTALQLGDDTAQRQGRLTLDPLAHIDPVGTVLLPLIGVPFGWARPVPVEPTRFDTGVSMRAGMLLTALAGPLSNGVLAIGALGLSLGLEASVPALVAPGSAGRGLLDAMVLINVLLGLFNLLPIPPLDGSRIVDGLLPERLRAGWGAAAPLLTALLFALLALSVAAGLGPVWGPVAAALGL
ncbi:MAG TPA: site-2 protease family protein [Deltaproteobacteria bacterium]|nr:site-2 protease family protein [Deltaproteobacteria bacterium]